MKVLFTIWIILLIFIPINQSYAQVVPISLKAFVQDEQTMKNEGVRYPILVQQVYQNNNFMFLWLPYPILQQDLFQLISSVKVYGLEEKDYHYSFIRQFRFRLSSITTARDSFIADIKLTDALIQFLYDVKNGN